MKGDVRVCTIGTTEAPANDITVITNDDWTIVLDSSQAKRSSKSDSVAQQIIAKLGGTLQASK